MKISSPYDDAIDAGLTRREASFIAAAQEIATIAREVRSEQSAFLAGIGMTWEEARALDEDGRASLNEQWLAYKANSSR